MMELKRGRSTLELLRTRTPNRTMMELKLAYLCSQWIVRAAPNRTMMELKQMDDRLNR